MLNRDFAGSTLNIIRATKPNIEAPIQPDWQGVMNQALKDYNEGAYTKQMIEEHPEDANKIRQMGGSAYADMLKAEEQRAEERQWALDDRQAQRDFQREMLDLQTQRALGLEGVRQANAMKLAEFQNGLKDLAKAQADEEKAKLEQESYDQAQNGINQLYDVADRNNIGVFTDWRRKHGLTGKETEQEYGRISSAVAAVAPRAISKLKAAGVTGINSLPEFMTYIGLPQNPTSQQIMGALPMMAQIAGVENPINNKSLKDFNNNGINAPMINPESDPLGLR